VAAPLAIPASLSVRVIDGDTISLEDGKPNVRLVGFNAPETGNRARCDVERQNGEAAKQRLRELVSNGRSDFDQIACSCASGTEGTDACNFGRRCGTLRVNGVDVGSTLINEGLAVRCMRRNKLSDASAPLVLTRLAAQGAAAAWADAFEG